jgi:hypothetical protein
MENGKLLGHKVSANGSAILEEVDLRAELMQNPMQDLGDIIIGDALGVPLRLEAPSVSGIYLLQISKETAEDPDIIWKKLTELLTGSNGHIQKHSNATLHDSVIFEDVNRNVGIGTVTPRFNLDVAGIINTSDSVLSDLGEFGSSLQANGLTGMVARGVENDESITFLTRDQARVVIDEDGNVGIGTDEPATLLHLKFDEANAGLLLENTRASGTRRVRFDLKTTNGVSPGSYFRFLLRGDEYNLLQTVRDEDYNDGEGRWVELYQFDYRERTILWGSNPSPSFGIFDFENIRFGLKTTSPDYTLHCIGDISGSAYRVGSTPGIDMASGTPTGVVINKGIVTAATRVIPIADGNYRISDGDTITTVGGIITAIS